MLAQHLPSRRHKSEEVQISFLTFHNVYFHSSEVITQLNKVLLHASQGFDINGINDAARGRSEVD